MFGLQSVEATVAEFFRSQEATGKPSPLSRSIKKRAAESPQESQFLGSESALKGRVNAAVGDVDAGVGWKDWHVRKFNLPPLASHGHQAPVCFGSGIKVMWPIPFQ
jgi:hypothetical protein